MESVLGVKGVLGAKPQSWLDRVAMMREGIPAAAVESIIGAVYLSQAQLARVLGISERALARRMREGVLSSDESSRLLCLARVVSRAHEVFDDPAAAVDWLKSRNAALRGNAPLSLLDTDIRAECVLDALGSIEHGVFA